MKDTTSTRGWLLYDGSCGFCRRWVPFWEKTLRKRGFAIDLLQSDWVRRELNAADDQLLQDLRLVLADGQQVLGADAYRYLMRRIWWAFPIYLLASAPLFDRIFDRGYRTFADNRYRISQRCGLEGAPDAAGGSPASGSVRQKD